MKVSYYSIVTFFINEGEPYKFDSVLDDYEIIRVLGSGGFGSVEEARHKKTGETVAIKYADISMYLNMANELKLIF